MKKELEKYIIVGGILFIILAIVLFIIPNFMVTLLGESSNYNAKRFDYNASGPSIRELEEFTIEMLEGIGGGSGNAHGGAGAGPWYVDATPHFEINGINTYAGKRLAHSTNTDMALYCLNKGTILFESDPGLTMNHVTDLAQYGFVHGLGYGNNRFFSSSWTCSLPSAIGRKTLPWAVMSSGVSLMNEENINLAYILTAPDIGKWTEEKQEAVWATDIGGGSGSGGKLYKEANAYKEYFKKAQQEHGSIAEPKLDIKASIGNIEVLCDYNEAGGTHTIGPINLKYINENMDGAAFSGISNMYFEGYDKNGKKVKNVPINSYTDGTGTHALKQDTYYNPEYGKGYVDDGEQVYPDGKSSFYVNITNPNIGKVSTDEGFVAELKLIIEFKWMGVVSALANTYDTYQYIVSVQYDHHNSGCTDPSYDADGNMTSPGYCWFTCSSATKLNASPRQPYLGFYGGARVLFTTHISLSGFDITMDLGGNVWEEGLEGKESIADGVNLTKSDNPLSNIKVTLWARNKSWWTEDRKVDYTYTNDNGNYIFQKIGSLTKYYVTYEYNGQQYLPTDYLKVKENAESYSSVKEMIDESNKYKNSKYNTNNWKISSKGTESKTDRDNYNKQFESIESYPANYRVNKIVVPTQYLINGGTYNSSYSQYELMGFELNENGQYKKTGLALIDGFYIERNGNIVDTRTLSEQDVAQLPGKKRLQNGIISQKLEEYYKANKKMPNDIVNEIYRQIAGNDGEIWRKIQFIEDCKIISYTQNIQGNIDLYPIYDKFIINTTINDDKTIKNEDENVTKTEGKNYTSIEDKMNDPDYNMEGHEVQSEKNTRYHSIYPGQYQVNLGLWRRQEADLALRKDVYRAVVTVNGKTEVYKYDTRTQMTDEERAELTRLYEAYNSNRANTAAFDAYIKYQEQLGNKYWEIQGKIVAYPEYYGKGYNRELYESDYYFPGNDSGANKLQAYITYKIEICNQSESILAQIDEIVDYYDDTYEFQKDKSWMMYYGSSRNDISDITVLDQDYYDIMVGDTKISGTTGKYKEVSERTTKNNTTDFDSEFAAKNYKTLYINSLKNKKLQSGESAYLYLTFKVNGDGSSLSVERSKTDPGKQNIVEINGYSTYYRDGTKLPNKVDISGDNTPAGIIDEDSTPGNFRASKITNGKYEHNFEDDTDRARGINVHIENPNGDYMNRKTSGFVWEDTRNTIVAGAVIGNGIRDNGETLIDGIKVELLEVILDEKKNPIIDMNTGDARTKIARIYVGGGIFKDAVTSTNGGQYEFAGIVPGDYIVRFTYGGEGQNPFYNGQDYKSTSYQVNIAQDGTMRTDVSKESEYHYYGYDRVANTQNTSGSYGYDIYKTDKNAENVSDAKDLWAYRESVNNYSKNNVTYDKAALLDDITKGHEETKMIAETGVIRVEGEYNRQNTKANTDENGKIISNENYNGTSTGKDSYQGTNGDNGNTNNGYYHIKNVDLGLVERPKAQLELNKKVSNVKITLANQNVLIDAKGQMNDVQWVDKTAYEIKTLKNKNNNNIYQCYGSSNYDAFRNSVSSRIESCVKGNVFGYKPGSININMDEEIMHGATIQITYDMSVENVGEIDYDDKSYYYSGLEPDRSTIVKTSADVVLDYVSNNLQFRDASNNKTWSTVTKEVQRGQYDINFGNTTKNTLAKYNTIIQTTGLSNPLVPEAKTETKLVLSQLITAQNTDDDRCYNNVAEIVQISNDVGRRMAASVQGNQDPTVEKIHDYTAKLEPDSSIAEQVKVVPPFGIGNIVVYIVLTITVLGILIIGIIFIKKKVLE